MVEFREITAIKERKSIYPDRNVWLPHLTTATQGSVEHMKWMDENWWMVNYSVFMDDKPEALRLARELDALFKENSKHQAIPDILEQLRRLRTKEYGDLTFRERWTRFAFQLVEYAGGPEVRRTITQRLNKYTGTVLEAMCGHTSYFAESPGRTVIALDCCAVSLERYPFPQRRRIECDLNQTKDGTELSFLKNEEVDVISICFGFKYPEDIRALLREFLRVLKPGGKVSFIENPKSGYPDLCRRKFDRRIIKDLSNTGYRSIRFEAIHLPPTVWEKKRGEFHHVEATK
jgi:SAM-dependent methyltransferase